MSLANSYLKHIIIIRRNLRQITNYKYQYSQRCNYDDCDCIIPEPKCKRRPALVKEVNCEKCSFECWQYKPRPRCVVTKTENDLKKPARVCRPGMKDNKKQKVDKFHKVNEVDAPIGPCNKTFTGKIHKSCKMENPYSFENENIPLPDWDFNKRAHC